ncbi:putative protease [Prosthecobacter fusiformis]|uniref:Putative protease n=1 Tax=Prosthecobacter fusiformis TaxID=48464 RepID=A0A4R7RJB4_9BACT|nr:U32 family peptidase [Prosthecobacter fusiformis]TDU64237.1 putative protease [Prosthecobacter fusiformis]
MPRPLHLPELLSPAGNWECARAAVANGADAIFFGLPRFNARMRADNFTAEDLPELMKFLHSHGVKGYCAFNVLIFTTELADAETQLRELEAAGVDAVIVQDLGLARMVKTLTPGLRLHASTQMTITSPEGLELANTLGIDQAVLSRELSLRELERFQANDKPEVPLEVFVHGALCVAYSGQCLTSESLGRRSANRGECAQACRMPYEMIVDGELQDLGDKRYLLSPQDLAAVQEIPRLIELGIRSFKIEGRLKTPEYVAAVTRVYRKAIDAVLADKDLTEIITEEDRYELEMTFSRGLYTGWMHGVNHQELVGAYYGKKRGYYVGVVRSVARDAVELEENPTHLKNGDGIVFENLQDTNNEQGGRIYGQHENWIEFQHGRLRTDLIAPGTRIFKTGDQALEQRLRQTFQGEIPLRKKQPLNLIISGSAGQPMVIQVKGQEASATSTIPLAPALQRPLTLETLQNQLGRLGGTPFELGEIELRLEENLILPVSELNRMRRSIVESSCARQGVGEPSLRPAITTTVADMLRSCARQGVVPEDAHLSKAPTLHVLCRDQAQIEAALEANITHLYVDFEDVRQYADAVKYVKAHSAARIYLATPRIQKSGEAGIFKLISRAEPHGVLIRNLGAIAHFRDAGIPITGDFSLNVANPLTADFLKKTGLERLTISYDLNIDQVLNLLQGAPPEWFEITLHQHMPMFHMEHCAFAAFLSEGTDFTNCGRPCEKHKVRLRDRVGMEHPLKADVGCRNTLFNAVPQTGAQYFSGLMQTGLRHYRVELLEQTQEETLRIIRTYQSLLASQRGGEDIWRELKAQSQLGVTRGTMAEMAHSY